MPCEARPYCKECFEEKGRYNLKNIFVALLLAVGVVLFGSELLILVPKLLSIITNLLTSTVVQGIAIGFVTRLFIKKNVPYRLRKVLRVLG